MAIKAEFTIPVASVEFRTTKNGDQIRIMNVCLGATAAASLATLINAVDTELDVTIKQKGD